MMMMHRAGGVEAIEQVRLLTDKSNGNFRGIAYVDCETEESLGKPEQKLF